MRVTGAAAALATVVTWAVTRHYTLRNTCGEELAEAHRRIGTLEAVSVQC